MHGEGLVPLGVVARPHGVRGELRVHPYNPESSILLEQRRVWLRAGQDAPARDVRVERARPGDKGLLLRIEGCTRREDAEALRGHEVCVRRDDLPEPEEPDEHYVVDLVGMRVRRQDGTPVGQVQDVLSYPSVDCLQVPTERGVVEIPMVEPWVQRVDPEAGEITVGSIDDVPVQPERRGRRDPRE